MSAVNAIAAVNFQLLFFGAVQAAVVPDRWPPEVVAQVGDIGVRFESRSFWTIYRIDYRGERLGIDQFGSHYGTVAKIKGVGFIGSGHRENRDEQIVDVRLSVDGKEVDPPAANYTCTSIKMIKISKIDAINLRSEVVVENGAIVESVAYDVERVVDLDLIYHFMHPWSPSMSDYYASLPDGKEVGESFVGANDFKLNRPIVWTAVYDKGRRAGAVTRVVEASAERSFFIKYWDKSLPYKKFYFQAFTNKSLTPGERYSFSVKVVPFMADPSSWIDEAKRINASMERKS